MERINIDVFVDEFNKSNNRTQYVSEHIVRNYVPILEKKLLVGSMFEKSIIEDDKGLKYYDTLLGRINFILAMIYLYTDIDIINKDDKGYGFYCYDQLVENKVINIIKYTIGASEIIELNNVQECMIETFKNQYSSTEAFISRVVSSIGIGLDSLNKFIENLNVKEA